MLRQRRVATAAVLLACLGLSGCASPDPRSSVPSPVRLTAAAGGLKTVALTSAAARRLGIGTAAVQPVAGAPATARATARLVIPYAGVVYDDRGATWTYVQVRPQTYLRHSVSVDHIDGDRAYLRAGPVRGSLVVTTGSEELLGAEYQISGE